MLGGDPMIEGKVRFIFVCGFIVAFLSYSFYEILGEVIPGFFYKGLSISFACYTYAFMRVVRCNWYYFPMIAYYACLNKIYDELFGDPQTIELGDYIGFSITVLLVIFDKRIKNTLRVKNIK